MSPTILAAAGVTTHGEMRAVLTARKLVQSKLRDVENSVRGILRGLGLKVGNTTNRGFADGSRNWWPAIRALR